MEGRTVKLSGRANPGDTLRLEGVGVKGVSCKAASDGVWSMPEVELAPGEHILTVVDVAHPHRAAEVSFTISALRPIVVNSPLDGETLEAKIFEVTGKASQGRLVCFRLGQKTSTVRCDGHGSFRFKEVELTSWGSQRLLFYYAEDPRQGATELALHWPGLDLPSLVDPVTRARLEPGADVVRCDTCYTYCYRATWNRLRTCPRCIESGSFWERSNPQFHTPRIDLAPE